MHPVVQGKGTHRDSGPEFGNQKTSFLTCPGATRGWGHLNHVTAAPAGKALATNRTLRVLQLAGNRLRDAAAAEIASALLRNDELHELDLGDNCIGSEGGELLANALGGTDGVVPGPECTGRIL